MVVYRREGRHRAVLVAVVFTSLLLVTLDSRGNGIINSFRGTARDVLGPLREGVDDAFRPVRDLVGGVTDYGYLKDQNTRLKKRVADLEGRLQRERAVGSQVGELEKLLDLPTIEDATGIAARVVGTAAGNFERTVEINKGNSSGVFVGQPVVAGNGLVGKVTQASGTLATVTLIDSPGFGIGVRLENSGERGIAEGRTGERDMRLNFLTHPIVCPPGGGTPDCVSIKEGEFVFTAAVADAAFPPDIPVAKVVRFSKRQTDLETTIVLRPLVNLDDITFVKILRWPEPKPKAG